MSTISLAQSPSQLQPNSIVYEYSLTVFNRQHNDTQELTAAFISQPTIQNWQQWLTGWLNCGYRLSSSPRLINIIH
jgi:hypothetical protein